MDGFFIFGAYTAFIVLYLSQLLDFSPCYQRYTKHYCVLVIVLTLGACAHALIPKLEDRRLRITTGGLYYEYCKDRTFFRDKCKKWKRDFYDLNQAAIVKQLESFGFTCTSERRFTPR